MLAEVLLVGAGGFIGSVARFGVGMLTRARSDSAFPWATLIVNVIGCFAIGAAWAWFESRDGAQGPQWLFVVTGVLGGFTTFSAFGLETLTLFRTQGALPAAANVVASLVLGFGAVGAGRALLS